MFENILLVNIINVCKCLGGLLLLPAEAMAVLFSAQFSFSVNIHDNS